jgi:hypothetical protein
MLSDTLEEITDEFMLNVVLFFVHYRLKSNFNDFIDLIFKRNSRERSYYTNTQSILGFTEFINEENLSTRGIVEEKRGGSPKPGESLKKTIYKSPFVKPFSQYSSEMRIDRVFKLYICRELGIEYRDLTNKEEQNKPKANIRGEVQLNNPEGSFLSASIH